MVLELCKRHGQFLGDSVFARNFTFCSRATYFPWGAENPSTARAKCGLEVVQDRSDVGFMLGDQKWPQFPDSSVVVRRYCLYNGARAASPRVAWPGHYWRGYMDVRYSFLNTLDHYPCELIRGLWTLQSLDLQRAEPGVSLERERWLAMHMQSQSELVETLTEERIRALKSHRRQLVELQGVRKRCEVASKRLRRQTQQKPDKLTIKLNLKGKSKAAEPSKVQNVKPVEEEPQETYCFCNNVSYGAMIACDNDWCAREWFHYGCVGITKPPNGKWYCSVECREQAKKRK